MYQDEVRVPIGEWAKSRLKKLSETDKRRDNSRVGSGFGKNISNWIGRELAYPSNVLHLATETGNKAHSAVFPKELPAWFIRLFTKPGDMVLDPFLGSGTRCIAALDLDRKSMGIEIFDEYYDLAKNNIEKHLSRYQLKGKTPLPYAKLTYPEIFEHINSQIIKPFYDFRVTKINEVKLISVLKRKNPYLFKAKNITTAQDLVIEILQAHMSSQEETVFGNYLDRIGICIFSD